MGNLHSVLFSSFFPYSFLPFSFSSSLWHDTPFFVIEVGSRMLPMKFFLKVYIAAGKLIGHRTKLATVARDDNDKIFSI